MKASTYAAIGFVVTAGATAGLAIALSSGVPNGPAHWRLLWAIAQWAILWAAIGVELGRGYASVARRPAIDALTPTLMIAVGAYFSVSMFALTLGGLIAGLRPSYEIAFHAALLLFFVRPLLAIFACLVVSRDDELRDGRSADPTVLAAMLEAESSRLFRFEPAKRPGTPEREVMESLSRLAETLRYSMPAHERLAEVAEYIAVANEIEQVAVDLGRIVWADTNRDKSSDIVDRVAAVEANLARLRAKCVVAL